MPEKVGKRYIGDGVYAAIDEYERIVLTTEDGVRATNTIDEDMRAAVPWQGR